MKVNITRRDAVGCAAKVAGAFLALPYLSAPHSYANAANNLTLVNDIHSQLNPTRVNEVIKPQSAEQLAHIVCPLHNKGARWAWPESVMQWEVSNSARIPI